MMNTTPIRIAADAPYLVLLSAQPLCHASASMDRVAVSYTASGVQVVFPAWRFELGIGDLRLPGISGPESMSKNW